MDAGHRCTRRGIFAGVVAAVTGGSVARAAGPMPANGGNGGQGNLILGSNNSFTPNNAGPYAANIASVATDLEATPNFGNFTNKGGNHVMRVDARPASGGGNVAGLPINAIEGYAQFDGYGALGVGAPGFAASLGSAGVVGVMGNVAVPTEPVMQVGVAGIGGDSGIGVAGQGLVGVFGEATGTGVGVQAGSDLGAAFEATSRGGIGAILSGALAPLLLSAATNAGSPTTGLHTMGELYVDSRGALWCCTTTGTPGAWVGLSSAAAVPSFRPLATPERFIDTRSNLGGTQGPVPDAATHVFQMTGRTGLSGNAALQIPDTATSIVGNLSVIGGPTIPVGSFVTMWPEGPRPTTASINVGPGGVVGNFFVSRLGQAGGHGVISVFNQHTCDYVVDVTGYYST